MKIRLRQILERGELCQAGGADDGVVGADGL
jgi:hypothetical protein